MSKCSAASGQTSATVTATTWLRSSVPTARPITPYSTWATKTAAATTDSEDGHRRVLAVLAYLNGVNT